MSWCTADYLLMLVPPFYEGLLGRQPFICMRIYLLEGRIASVMLGIVALVLHEGLCKPKYMRTHLGVDPERVSSSFLVRVNRTSSFF